ncbi:hypothetical protein AUC68_10880 [Methyloceanibacter methanicus]|uniref:Uncharacterized protein n=1 Tax=Methyloceanibacter methanicus TaxID=1774968 RepID=A0A1E3VWU1_9HYPH|nr:hypothetical protein AUC68_10880 [Methyloceanibacter methanicus]
MRSGFIASGLALAALISTGAFAAEPDMDTVRCSAVRDSAQCAARPDCWYDAANGKGCLDGPAPAVDPCASHQGESTCNTSSFGCAWNTDAEACVSKAP